MAKAKLNSKQVIKNRTRLEWVLLAALLLILFLWSASRYHWWPLNSQSPELGTAFYVVKPKPGSPASGSDGNGSSGSASVSGGGGGSSSSSKSRLLTFAAGVNQGDSKEQTSAEGGGLDENCAVLVNAPSSAGKQEVCTYKEGDKLVTVTYLNDHVVSASRSGF